VKTGQKYVFHPCLAYIMSRLNVSYQVSAQNLKGLAFGFTDKCLFTAKMGQKSIFCPREAHIHAWLDIMVVYTFFEVSKGMEYRLKIQRG
jgi:hypothetical protein